MLKKSKKTTWGQASYVLYQTSYLFYILGTGLVVGSLFYPLPLSFGRVGVGLVILGRVIPSGIKWQNEQQRK